MNMRTTLKGCYLNIAYRLYWQFTRSYYTTNNHWGISILLCAILSTKNAAILQIPQYRLYNIVDCKVQNHNDYVKEALALYGKCRH